MSRLPALAIAPVLLAACRNVPSAPDLEPLEEPRALEVAPPPRVSGAIPVDRSRERAFTAQGVAESPVVTPPTISAAGGQAGDITPNFVDTDMREIARTILGTTLKLNYTIDPNMHGTLRNPGRQLGGSVAYRDAIALDRHSGGPQQKISDGAAFVWRSELAGQSRDTAAWRGLYGYATGALPRPDN